MNERLIALLRLNEGASEEQILAVVKALKEGAPAAAVVNSESLDAQQPIRQPAAAPARSTPRNALKRDDPYSQFYL